MIRDEAREWLVEFLLEKVREDAYPSTTHLGLIEQSIPRYMIPEYLEVLMDNVEQDRFPSILMLRRRGAGATARPSRLAPMVAPAPAPPHLIDP